MKGEAADHKSAPLAVCEAIRRPAAACGGAKQTLLTTAEDGKKTRGEELQATHTPIASDTVAETEKAKQCPTLETLSNWETRESLVAAANGDSQHDRVGGEAHGTRAKTVALMCIRPKHRRPLDLTSEILLLQESATPVARASRTLNAEAQEATAAAALVTAETPTIAASPEPSKDLGYERGRICSGKQSHFTRAARRATNGAIRYGGSLDGSSDSARSTCNSSSKSSISEACETPVTSASRTPLPTDTLVYTHPERLPSASDISPASASCSSAPYGVPNAPMSIGTTSTVPKVSEDYRIIMPQRPQQLQQQSAGTEEEDSQRQVEREYGEWLSKMTLLPQHHHKQQSPECVDTREKQNEQRNLNTSGEELSSCFRQGALFAHGCSPTLSRHILYPCAFEHTEEQAAAVASTKTARTQYSTAPASAPSADAACGSVTKQLVQSLRTNADAQAVGFSDKAAGGEAAVAPKDKTTRTAAAAAALEWKIVDEAIPRNIIRARTIDATEVETQVAAAGRTTILIGRPTGGTPAHYGKSILEACVDAQQHVNEEGLLQSQRPENSLEAKQAANKNIGATVQNGARSSPLRQLRVPAVASATIVPLQTLIRQSADQHAAAVGVTAPAAALWGSASSVGTEHLLSGGLAPNVFSHPVFNAAANIADRTGTANFSTPGSFDDIAVENSNATSTSRLYPNSRLHVASAGGKSGNQLTNSHRGSTGSSSSRCAHDTDTNSDNLLSPECCRKQESYRRDAYCKKSTFSCEGGNTTNSICTSSSKDTCSRNTSKSPDVTSYSSEKGSKNDNTTRQCSSESLSASNSVSQLLSHHRVNDRKKQQNRNDTEDTTEQNNWHNQKQQHETSRQDLISCISVQEDFLPFPADKTAVLHCQPQTFVSRMDVGAAVSDEEASDARKGRSTHDYLEQRDRATADIAAAVVAVADGQLSTLEPAQQSANSAAVPDGDVHVKCGVGVQNSVRVGPTSTANINCAAARTSHAQRDVLSWMTPKKIPVAEVTTPRKTGNTAVQEETFVISKPIAAASEATSAMPHAKLRAAAGEDRGDTVSQASRTTFPPLEDVVIQNSILGRSCVALSLETFMTLLLQKQQLLDVVHRLLMGQRHPQTKQSLQMQEAQQQSVFFMQQQDQQQQESICLEQGNQKFPALLKQQRSLDLPLQQRHSATQQTRLHQQQQLEHLLLQQRLQVQNADQRSVLTSCTSVKPTLVADFPIPLPHSTVTGRILGDDSSRDNNGHGNCRSGSSSERCHDLHWNAGVFWNEKHGNCHLPHDEENLLHGVPSRHTGETHLSSQRTEEQILARLRGAVPVGSPLPSASGVSGGGAQTESSMLCASCSGEKVVEQQIGAIASTKEQRNSLRFIGDLPTVADRFAHPNFVRHSLHGMPEAAEMECQLLLHSLPDASSVSTAARPSEQHVNVQSVSVAPLAAGKDAGPLDSVIALDSHPNNKRATLAPLREYTSNVNCPTAKRARKEIPEEAPAHTADQNATFTAALRHLTLADGTSAGEVNIADLASAAWGAVTRPARNGKMTAATREKVSLSTTTGTRPPQTRVAASLKRRKADVDTIDYAVRAQTCERVSGVCFDRWNQGWIATWRKQRRPVHKHYSVKKYGFEQARLLAIRHRSCMVLQQQQEQWQKDQLSPQGDRESQKYTRRRKAAQLLGLQENDQWKQSQADANTQQDLERRHQPQPNHNRLQQSQTNVNEEPPSTADRLKWCFFCSLTGHESNAAVQASAAFAAGKVSPAASPSAVSSAKATSGLQPPNIAGAAAAADDGICEKVTHNVAAADATLASDCLDDDAVVRVPPQAPGRNSEGDPETAGGDEQTPHVATFKTVAQVDAATLVLPTLQESPTAKIKISALSQAVTESASIRDEAAALATVKVRNAPSKRGAPASRPKCQIANTPTNEGGKVLSSTAGAARDISQRKSAPAAAAATQILQTAPPETSLERFHSPQQRFAMLDEVPLFPYLIDRISSVKGDLQPQQGKSKGCPDIGALVATMPKVERVSFDFTNHSWIAQWKQHGSATYRRFAVSKFGFYGAFQLAVMYKEQHYRPTVPPATTCRTSGSAKIAGGQLAAPVPRGRRGARGGGHRSTTYKHQRRQHQPQLHKHEKCVQRSEEEARRPHGQNEGKESESIQVEDALGPEGDLHRQHQQEASEEYRGQLQGGDLQQEGFSRKQHLEAARDMKEKSTGPEQHPPHQHKQLVPVQGKKYQRENQARRKNNLQHSPASRHHQLKEDKLFQKEPKQLHPFTCFVEEENFRPVTPEGNKERARPTKAPECPHSNGGLASFAKIFKAGHPETTSPERAQGQAGSREAVGEEYVRSSKKGERKQPAGALLGRDGGRALADHSTRRDQKASFDSGDSASPALEEDTRAERPAGATFDEIALASEGKIAVMPSPVSLDARTRELLRVTAAASADCGDHFFSAAAQMNTYVHHLLSHSGSPVRARPQQGQHEDGSDCVPQLQRRPEAEAHSWMLRAQQQTSLKQGDAAAAASHMNNRKSGCEATLLKSSPLAFSTTYRDPMVAQPSADAVCGHPATGKRPNVPASAATPSAATTFLHYADPVLPTDIAAASPPQSSLC